MVGKKIDGTIMGIDPSINDLGLAVFQHKKPVFWTLLHPETGLSDEYQKCVSLYNQLFDYRDKWQPDHIVLETPDHWAVGGFEARESGSIQKLTFLCGMLYTFGNVTLTLPRGWKKQLPKNVVRNRMKPVYPDIIDDKLNHNIMDAICIAHWFIFGKV